MLTYWERNILYDMQPDDNDESNVKDSILDDEEENVDEEANDTDVEMKEEETSAKANDNEDIDQDTTIYYLSAP